jgi:hypothetical protein
MREYLIVLVEIIRRFGCFVSSRSALGLTGRLFSDSISLEATFHTRATNKPHFEEPYTALAVVAASSFFAAQARVAGPVCDGRSPTVITSFRKRSANATAF